MEGVEGYLHDLEEHHDPDDWQEGLRHSKYYRNLRYIEKSEIHSKI